MSKRMMKRQFVSRSKVSWSWALFWPRRDKLQVAVNIFRQMPVVEILYFVQTHHHHSACFFRAWRLAEVCEAFLDIHKQGKGSTVGALAPGSISGHGGSHGPGG